MEMRSAQDFAKNVKFHIIIYKASLCFMKRMEKKCKEFSYTQTQFSLSLFLSISLSLFR